MNRRCFPVYFVVFGVLSAVRAESPVTARSSAGAESIVPPSDQVSAMDARKELVGVLRKLGRLTAAEAEIRTLLESRPNDPTLLTDLADVEASRGHFGRSRELYDRALSSSGNASEVGLRYARQAQSWGDFYRSERLFRAYLREHPNDTDALLDLAGVLVAEQRYEAAEGEYRALAKDAATKQKALIGLGNCRLQARDYKAVLPFSDAVLEANPDQIEALNLRGEALRSLRRYEEAAVVFRRLSRLPGGRREGLIGLGRLARARKDEASAKEYFARAQILSPEDVTARYLYAGEHAADADFLHEIVTRRNLPVMEMTSLAGLYASDARFDSAITVFQAALARDSEYFPARIGLAEALAGADRYDESIKLLTQLRGGFPDDAKIILAQARVLSWSHRFDDSLRTYRELSALNPADTTLLKEMARVASWSKQMRLARDIYAEIYTPSVDDQLVEALKHSGHGQAVVGVVGDVSGKTKAPYETYERLRQLLDSGGLPFAVRSSAEAALSNLLAVYLLQKAAWLESNAKRLAWNKRFIRAVEADEQLLALQAGNEEAWLDLASAQTSQGLSLKSTASYHQLLQLDAWNTVAGQALELEQIREHPGLYADYTYFDEKGTGRNADIALQHDQAGGQFYWNAKTQVRVGGDYWYVEPGTGPHADAAGATIGIRTAFNEYWRASLEWTNKQYYDSAFSATNTGHADVTFNAWDYVRLTLQGARLDLLDNQFALEQDAHTDNLSLLFDSEINHNIAVSGGATWSHYTDNNQGVWLTIAPAFILLDEPHTLKLVLRGDYRNTQNLSTDVFEGGKLVNIIHPYWTPQGYTRGTVILEWREQFSRESFAGAEMHYLALRIGGGTDSTGNNNVLLEAEWHYDFFNHWTLEARGTLDRSPAWNGTAASLSLIYRF